MKIKCLKLSLFREERKLIPLKSKKEFTKLIEEIIEIYNVNLNNCSDKDRDYKEAVSVENTERKDNE